MSYWSIAYKYGWANLDQLKSAVILNCITVEEYKTITGEDYG